METENTYSTNVRIGNWYEAICLEEDEVSEFLKKRAQNQLIVQKTRFLMQNFYKELELSPYSPTVRFGLSLQLIAAQMRICKTKMSDEIRPALSIIINEKMINKTQNISEKCELTVAPSIRPCARNSFVIESGDEFDRNNETLKYNQDFRIRCLLAEEQPLYVYCTPKSPNLTTIIQNSFLTIHRGEINLPVGLILGRNTGKGSLVPEGYTRWRCVHIDPNKRFETEGTPVPSNTPLLIKHSPTNRNLAAENTMISTLFGPECLISAQTYKNMHGTEDWQNIWMLNVGQVQKDS